MDGRLVFALPAGAGERTLRMMQAVRDVLVEGGRGDADVRVPSVGLPSPEARSGLPPFAATPGALVETWRVARHLESITEPGDTVVVPDRWGFGGMFALEQSDLQDGERRYVWTIAGDGIGLEAKAIAGTTAGLDGERIFALDWEITQYRFSDRVLAISDRAMDLVAPFVNDVAVVLEAAAALEAQAPARPMVWLPESVSRRSQSDRALRAISGVLADRPDAELVAGTGDEDDGIWSGTTWDVADPIHRFRTDHISRSDEVPAGHPIVILGDPFAIPPPRADAARRSGSHVLVAAGSAAAAMWPDAVTWRTEDDLAAALESILDTTTPPMRRSVAVPVGEVHRERAKDPDRARAVSVGVPVYRNVAYLDECIESILNQTESVHEILLLDDGSNSSDVDRALGAWGARDPSRVRVLRQANRGVCVARNHLIAEMTGDSFLLVDHDDVLDPDFVRLTAEALRQDSSLWAVATWTEFFGDYEGVEAKPPFDQRVGQRENTIVSTAALVDMRVRDEGIAFAPDLAFIFCEDWHYWSQIVAAGGRMGLVPRALVRHRVHQTSGGFRRTELAARIGTARAIEPLLGLSPS